MKVHIEIDFGDPPPETKDKLAEFLERWYTAASGVERAFSRAGMYMRENESLLANGTISEPNLTGRWWLSWNTLTPPGPAAAWATPPGQDTAAAAGTMDTHLAGRLRERAENMKLRKAISRVRERLNDSDVANKLSFDALNALMDLYALAAEWTLQTVDFRDGSVTASDATGKEHWFTIAEFELKTGLTLSQYMATRPERQGVAAKER